MFQDIASSGKLGFSCLFAFVCSVLCLVSTECGAQQAPTVEIEINRSADTGDDFVTWAPTFCRTRVTSGVATGNSLAVTLTNAATNLNGRVRFATAATPWPANTTATEATLDLMLPGNGDWVEFVIAGEFGRASVRREDTVIIAKTSAGVEVGRQALMVRVRKDARKLTGEERDRLLRAIARLHLVQGRYEIYVEVHRIGLDEAHGGSAFLPWHRAFILHLERALQRIDPAITLPYWKYDEPTSQTHLPANLQLFGRDFMGGDTSSGNAAFSTGHPIRYWTINGLSGIYRGLLTTNHTVLPQLPGNPAIRNEASTLAPTTFDPFSNGDPAVPQNPGLEGDPHGYAHVWAGFNDGWIRQVRISPRDPLFFLLHCNVDRQWARWQWQHNRFGMTPADFSPTGSYPGAAPPDRARIGHYLDDTMWPWNGKQGDPATPADPLDDRPASAPGGSFPAAIPFILGPPTAPKPKDVIDYLGRQDPAKGLGFCYDDVSFAPATTPPPPPVPFAAAELTTLLDDTKPAPQRIAAAGMITGAPVGQLKKIFALAGAKEADPTLRLAALQATPIPNRKEAIEELVRLSKDTNAPPELRRNLASRLHFALNFSHAAHEQRGPVLEALRGLLNDPDLKVRSIAASSLAGFDDAASLERLAEGLKNPAKEIVPAEEALRLLSGTQQPGYYDLFKKFFEDRSNPATRVVAVRGLARFPQGVKSLKEILGDKSQSEEFRMAVLEALNANDREDFPVYAIDVATDAHFPEPLRSYALGAMANHVESVQFRNVVPKYDVSFLNAKVRELATKASPEDIREQAWTYLQHCDKEYLHYAPDMINKESDSQLRLRLKDDYLREQTQRAQRRNSKD